MNFIIVIIVIIIIIKLYLIVEVIITIISTDKSDESVHQAVWKTTEHQVGPFGSPEKGGKFPILLRRRL